MSKYKAWKSFEREVARDLQKIDPTARRNIEECREGSHDILNAMGFAIQCKHGLSPNIWKALEQAERSQLCKSLNKKQATGDIPMAVVRRKKFGTVAVLRWKDFLELLKYAHNSGLGYQEPLTGSEEFNKRKLSLQENSLKYKKDSERLSSDMAGTSDNRG